MLCSARGAAEIAPSKKNELVVQTRIARKHCCRRACNVTSAELAVGGDKIILPVACGVASMLLGIMIIVVARKYLLRKCLCRNVEVETEAEYINAETVQLQSMLPPLPSHVPPIPLQCANYNDNCYNDSE